MQRIAGNPESERAGQIMGNKNGETDMKHVNILIVGGGPAGLAAAAAAYDVGERDILILERDDRLGGILNQCIHNGFGLHTFKEELTGPEYAARYEQFIEERQIPYLLQTMVLDISREKVVTAVNRDEGMIQIQAEAVILAMGCRERPRGALSIPGFRPAGIYTAGTAQRLVNMEGYMPGREVVILGSGDIGLIMARRMTLEGAHVQVVAELMPYSGGLKRNIVQCLHDYDIPLKLKHTVVKIEGKKRVEGIMLAEVDEQNRPIPGTEEHYTCDTLLLSCGLIPENELSLKAGVTLNPVTNGPEVNESLQTDVEGIFACGNVLHVHDLVDYVSEEAAMAGKHAADYVRAGKNTQPADSIGWLTDEAASVADRTAGDKSDEKDVPVRVRDGVRYTVPGHIRPAYVEDRLTIRFRVGKVYRDHYISVYLNSKRIQHRKKQIMAPGEMEQVILTKKQLMDARELENITICLESE